MGASSEAGSHENGACVNPKWNEKGDKMLFCQMLSYDRHSGTGDWRRALFCPGRKIGEGSLRKWYPESRVNSKPRGKTSSNRGNWRLKGHREHKSHRSSKMSTELESRTPGLRTSKKWIYNYRSNRWHNCTLHDTERFLKHFQTFETVISKALSWTEGPRSAENMDWGLWQREGMQLMKPACICQA